jgi:hypothetical protein
VSEHGGYVETRIPPASDHLNGEQPRNTQHLTIDVPTRSRDVTRYNVGSAFPVE